MQHDLPLFPRQAVGFRASGGEAGDFAPQSGDLDFSGGQVRLQGAIQQEQQGEAGTQAARRRGQKAPPAALALLFAPGQEINHGGRSSGCA